MKIKELKEDLRLLLIAYEMSQITDYIDEDDKGIYEKELLVPVSVEDFDIIFKKHNGAEYHYINDKIRNKTQQLINII